MSGHSGMEYHKDIAGERLYASRNHNSLRHTYQAPGANRGQTDWLLTLRQNRKPLALNSSQSAPNLSEGNTRERQPLAPEHADGSYHSENETVGKYQNFANTQHMVGRGAVRTSSGAAHSLDWMLNLRGSLHKDEFKAPGWRRHFARPQQSFEKSVENCSVSNEEYQTYETTPDHRVPDRQAGAVGCATIRDDPISFRRMPGCEGTHAGQWQHLLECRSHGHKARRQIQWETTLRETPGDTNGARIADNRSDGCLVEMLGKKMQAGSVHHEPFAQRGGDPTLHHRYNTNPLPQDDPHSRDLRMKKQQRHAKEAGEAWESKGGRTR
mmetsp:Transcript_173435/g.556312  ORF Transcript_173435/g.556312 Transcript_173435/m.556312 type:complete len:325 (-) Transcript_173435:97-1071(-)